MQQFKRSAIWRILFGFLAGIVLAWIALLLFFEAKTGDIPGVLMPLTWILVLPPLQFFIWIDKTGIAVSESIASFMILGFYPIICMALFYCAGKKQTPAIIIVEVLIPLTLLLLGIGAALHR